MSKKALIIGSAPCVWDDLEAAPSWPRIVVNAMGLKIPAKIEHWCSFHGVILCDRVRKRLGAGYNMDFQAHGHFGHHVKVPPDVKQWVKAYHTPMDGLTGRGSSGMFAVEVALMLGYDKLILCGIPLKGGDTIQDERIDRNKSVRDKYQNHHGFYSKYRHIWEKNEERLWRHVRSMSGWTRMHFGEPTKPWMEE